MIIGLIVGGILVGKNLIEAAEVRNAMTSIEKLKTSINAFILKYDCLPGDCVNATKFFPTCVDVSEWPHGYFNSCNGTGTGVYSPDPTRGMIRFFQHLYLSGMSDKPVNGIWGSVLTPGVNVPQYDWLDKNRIRGGATGDFKTDKLSLGIIDNWWGYQTTNGCELWQPVNIALRNSDRRIMVQSINDDRSTTMCPGYGGLSRDFTLKLDKKFDDGLPYSGTIQVPNYVNAGGSSNCSNATAYYTSPQNTTNDTCWTGFLN